MKYKDLIEGVIVPPKIKINTTNIKELNKKFKNTIIQFDYDTGMHGAYLPQLNKIKIFITKDSKFKEIESLVQHEIIHYMQDIKSGGKMLKSIQLEFERLEDIEDEIDDLDEDDEIDQLIKKDLEKKYNELKIKTKYLNNEEKMAYAYMFVYLRKTNNIKDIIGYANSEWKKWTGKKLCKKMLKYIYTYWTVKDKL